MALPTAVNLRLGRPISELDRGELLVRLWLQTTTCVARCLPSSSQFRPSNEAPAALLVLLSLATSTERERNDLLFSLTTLLRPPPRLYPRPGDEPPT